MKRSFCQLAAAVLILGALPAGGSPQFTPKELADRPAIEATLRNAGVVRSEKIGAGVTKPTRVYLRHGDTEISGVWKDTAGRDPDYPEGWRHEIAAYRLDVLLGLGMVPPTVERRFHMRKCSLQFWVPGLTSEHALFRAGREIPADRLEHCGRMQQLCNAFDSLIANVDRNQGNFAYTEDWRVILIDHSRSFSTNRFYVEQLVCGDKGMKRVPLVPLPKAFVRRVRGLTAEAIREAVGKYLNTLEIRAVMKRRDLLLAEIDGMIDRLGEDAVLYD
ncbi:MAG: hypothetical protein FJY79_01975 [Candidatus Aminicenantes bacterium]|nr:hypothetical protein [Candidatus Aminicenantes bacterium]